MFSISFNIKVYFVFSLESLHRGDSNEYTEYTIFNEKITLNYPKSAAMGFFIGTQERVRAIEVLLYMASRGRSS